jgi:hypothetical protein
MGQGLIFASDNIEDLMNTKQYLKMTDKELKKWWTERTSGHLGKVQFLNSEPIAYFDLEEKVEITVDAKLVNRPVKYIKLIPTAFRKGPINFSSKPFNSNQVEIQFFGINGYEIPNHGQQQSQIDKIAQNITEKLEIPIQISLEETLSKFAIGSIE